MNDFAIVGSRSKGNCVATHRPASIDMDVICSFDNWNSFVKRQAQRKELVRAVPLSGTKMMMELKRNDWDGIQIYEAEVWYSEDDHAYRLFDYIKRNHEEEVSVSTDTTVYHANLDTLYMMKMSHRFLKNSPHFQKTRKDILALREAGAKEPEGELLELFKEREDLTYVYKHPKLNVSKKEFFTDDVPYVYDHDSIHRAVAIGSTPAYTHFTTGEVMFSNKLFNEAPKALKLLSGLEEAMVLALERSIVPFTTDPTAAFKIALEKVCTSITSGDFRNFCWENYDTIMAMFDPEGMMNSFKQGLANGTVTVHNK